MFDRLIVSAGRAARRRSPASLGVALLTHASFVAALLLVPLLCPEMVMPDPGDVLAFVGPPVIVPPPLPPRAGGGGSPPETASPPARPTVSFKPGAVYAPREISDHIPPPDEPFMPIAPATATEGPGWGPPGQTGGPGTIGVAAEAMDLYAGGPPEVAPPPPPPPPAAPVRVKATVLSARLIHRVEPEYPLAARLARKEDTVILQVRVDETGRVDEVTVISGNVLFRQAAVAAVRQWVYTPLLINGMPRPVMGTVVLRFILR